MKKLIISFIVLLLIIALGIISIRYMNTSSKSIAVKIERVSALINENKWESAKSQMKDLEKEWNSTEKTWALLTDHFEIDNIELSMLKSKEYIDTKNISLSLAELENLKFMVEHIYEKEKFSLKNIF